MFVMLIDIFLTRRNSRPNIIINSNRIHPSNSCYKFIKPSSFLLIKVVITHIAQICRMSIERWRICAMAKQTTEPTV